MATLTQNSNGVWTDSSGSTEGFSNVPGPFDPQTGQRTGTTPSASPSLGSLAPTQNPTPTTGGGYSQFTINMASLLNQLQNATTAGNANLSGTKNALTNESVTTGPGFNPNIDAGANSQNMSSATNAFTPAITAASNFQQNFANNSQVAATNLNTAVDALKPAPVPEGSTLVAPDGTIVYKGNSYTAQINNSTGLQDAFDSVTGQWLSSVKSQDSATNPPQNVTPGQQALVGGVNVAGYNGYVNPNYAADVNRSYQDLEKTFPVPTAQNLDTYIQNNAKNSPITGNMIIKASQTYGVPPNVLAAVLNDESDFGTTGQAVKTVNPGNNGNNGVTTKTYSSWQAGVNAAAETLSNYIVNNTSSPSGQPSSNSNGITSDPRGGQYSPSAAAKVAQLPTTIQSYVRAGPGGVAYIDFDNVPQQLQYTANSFGEKAGIPVFSSADVAAMESINTISQQMGEIQNLVNNTLGSGVGSRITNTANVLLSKIFPNATLTKFNSYINGMQAADNIKTLVGGQGSGIRVTGAEISSALDGLPTQYDSIQEADAKIQAINDKIAQAMKNNFPDYNPTNGIVTPQTGSPVGVLAPTSGVTPSGISYTIQ